MAVQVTIQKPGTSSTDTITHDTGKSYGIKDGILAVFNDAVYQRSTDQVAVYGPGQWLSAVVTQAE